MIKILNPEEGNKQEMEQLENRCQNSRVKIIIIILSISGPHIKIKRQRLLKWRKNKIQICAACKNMNVEYKRKIG